MKKKNYDMSPIFKIMDNALNELTGMMNADSEMMELAAIWLEKKVNGKIRFKEGDLIAVEDGKMIEHTHATHKILGCYGTMLSTRLEFMVSDVITNDVSILKIK